MAQGHIRKRGNKWAAVVFIGYDENGKKKYKWFSGFDTKKAAQRALTEKLSEIDNGTYVDTRKMTFRDLFDSWMQIKRGQLRPNTIKSYLWLIDGHIKPKLGKYELKQLTPIILQNFYAGLSNSDKPLSNRSIQYAHTLIHGALNHALKWGYVGRNVANAVMPPRVEKSKGMSWDAQQAAVFLEAAAKSKWWIAFVIATMTGMRKGEILALHWRDVDVEHGIAQVRFSLTWIDGKPIFQAPKTVKGKRAVALPPQLVNALTKWKRMQAKERLRMGSLYEDNDLVVPRTTGQPLNPRNLDDAWYRILESTGLPKIRFHDLRHTHASLLLQQGVHPKIVSERLGHSNVNITLDTYSHVLPGMQEQAAATFADVLDDAKRKKS